MTWALLLAQNRVKTHTTSLAEINDLRELIDRDLADADVSGLSADRSFAIAYNAALQIAQMVIACHGYRVRSISGHHQATFEALELVFGTSSAALCAYLDVCRQKRNIVEYDRASVATDTEAAELRSRTKELYDQAEEWISKHHPSLRRKR